MPAVKTAKKNAERKPNSDQATESLPSATQKCLVSAVNDWADFEVRLSQIVRAYKEAQFNENLGQAARALHLFLRAHERKTESSYWKALTLIYELNDIFHFDDSINEQALNLGITVYNELRALSIEWDKGNPAKELAKEKVMYCSCRANELKRHGEIDAAGNLFEWLLQFTAINLQTEAFPYFGTQARLTYHLGAIYRILERHNEAEEKYTQTLDLLYQRAQMRTDRDERLFIIRRQAMAIGIGFGWVNASRGALGRAENALTTARSLLAGIKDPIVPPYIELLYGIIKRCRAGRNKAKLRKAIESLEAASESFNRNNQDRFVPAASWELSLAFSLLPDYPKAEYFLKKVADYAEEVGHPKWLTNVRILRSRILRNQGDCDGALKEANFAVNQAEHCKSVLPLTNAYIARGEAQFSICEKTGVGESYEPSRTDFERALELISHSASNPKIVAVCELRIAQCFVRDGDEANARLHFNHWEMLRSSVEHELVREIGEEVKREIEGLLMNFTISAKEPKEWNYTTNVTRLRSWLLNQALRHTKRNYSAAAELIGVKRGTLYQWQDDTSSQSQRARTNKSVS
jgi:DNA-binding protein Fis